MEFQLKPYIWFVIYLNDEQTYKTRHLQYMCYLCSSNDEGALVHSFSSWTVSFSLAYTRTRTTLKYSHIILCDSSIVCVYSDEKCFFSRLFVLATGFILAAFMCNHNWIYFFRCLFSLCVRTFLSVTLCVSVEVLWVGCSLGGETQITKHLKTKKMKKFPFFTINTISPV